MSGLIVLHLKASQKYNLGTNGVVGQYYVDSGHPMHECSRLQQKLDFPSTFSCVGVCLREGCRDRTDMLKAVLC